MNQELLHTLCEITEEEQHILKDGQGVEKTLYTSGTDFTVDSRKMLEAGRLIALRTHTRFVHFPLHRHNYVEVIYVCKGAITNLIGGKEVVVQEGDLLFLNQYTRHEILPAAESDVAINFIVLPEFFDVASSMIGSDNVLADFLVNILRRNQQKGEYLHFKVADVLQIQNLLENMIYSLVHNQENNDIINQTTMGILFLYLLDSVPYAETSVPNQYENMIIMNTLNYIEQQYPNATLTQLCLNLHQPMHALSKLIKNNTGYNFKELLQRRRLNKAAELICDTNLPVNDIIAAVGYENNSYFHRIFKERYGMTPRHFRVENQKKEMVRI
ncbi:MAG: AraC family transcriptional regulator [Lachnospiraceae bacterium]|nr:AraC family transcriptional regulator [Lachnospiraceae bacterium]